MIVGAILAALLVGTPLLVVAGTRSDAALVAFCLLVLAVLLFLALVGLPLVGPNGPAQ